MIDMQFEHLEFHQRSNTSVRKKYSSLLFTEDREISMIFHFDFFWLVFFSAGILNLRKKTCINWRINHKILNSFYLIKVLKIFDELRNSLSCTRHNANNKQQQQQQQTTGFNFHRIQHKFVYEVAKYARHVTIRIHTDVLWVICYVFVVQRETNETCENKNRKHKLYH